MPLSFEQALQNTRTVQTTTPAPTLAPSSTTSNIPAPAPIQPQVKNVTNNINKNVIQPVQRFASAGLGKIGDLLMAPSYGFGGFLQGTYDRAKQLAPSVKQNPLNIVPYIGKSLFAGAKNIVPSIQTSHITPGQYLTNNIIKPKNPIAKAGLGFATDVTTDPLNLVGGEIPKVLGKGGQLLGKAGELASKLPGGEKVANVATKVMDGIGTKLIYGYKVPKDFLGAHEAYQRGISSAADFASNLAGKLKYDSAGKELPQHIQQIIGDALGIAANGTNKALTPEDIANLKKYQPIVEQTLNEFRKLAEEQIRLGADPKIFENLIGKYYGKRTYATKLVEDANKAVDFAKAKAPRLDLSVYKNRADIPEEVRKAMGEIKTPSYGAAVSAYAEKANIEKQKLFRWVAKNYVDKGENLVQLPKTEKLGVLSGRMVPKQIEEHLNQIINPVQDNVTSKILNFFKKGKTIYSPKQLARNVIASQFQAYMNPSGAADSIKRIPEAIAEIRNKGKYYQEAKQAGLVGQTYAANELNKFLPEEIAKLQKGGNWISRAYNKVGEIGTKIQNSNEEMAKMQVFINERKNGKTIADAVKAAEETGFNYSKVTPFVKDLRSGRTKLGPLPFSVPFATYGIKSAELTGKTLINKPTRITNLIKAERAIEQTSAKNAPNEKYLPDYQKTAMRLPVKNAKGNSYYINTKYLYPYGNLQDVSPLPFGMSPDPFYQEAVTQFNSHDSFTGKDVGKQPGVLGYLDRAKHVAETFGPGYLKSGAKIIDAAIGKKKTSTSPTVPEAVLQEAGVPLIQYDPKRGAVNAGYDKRAAVSDAKAQLKKFLKDNRDNTKGPVYKYQLNLYRDNLKKALSQ